LAQLEVAVQGMLRTVAAIHERVLRIPTDAAVVEAQAILRRLDSLWAPPDHDEPPAATAAAGKAATP
jgi:hypothetical protein